MSANFTPAQHKMLAAGFQCFDAQPKVDYTKLAELLGLKNAASAKIGWCALRKKLLGADASAIAAITDDGGAEAEGEADGGKAKGKGSAKGRKRKVDEVDEGRKDSASPAPAPKKRSRQPKAAKKAERESEEGDGDAFDEPEIPVKEEAKSDDGEGAESNAKEGGAIPVEDEGEGEE